MGEVYNIAGDRYVKEWVYQKQKKKIEELENQRKELNIEVNDLKSDLFQMDCAFRDKCDEVKGLENKLAEAADYLKNAKLHIQSNCDARYGFDAKAIGSFLDSLEEKGGD